MNSALSVGNIISWLVGIVVLAIGVVNTFWGNDPGFGIFVFLLAFAFLPPANAILQKVTGFSIPVVAKVILSIFIFWAALGVGELFAKIELMKMDF